MHIGRFMLLCFALHSMMPLHAAAQSPEPVPPPAVDGAAGDGAGDNAKKPASAAKPESGRPAPNMVNNPFVAGGTTNAPSAAVTKDELMVILQEQEERLRAEFGGQDAASQQAELEQVTQLLSSLGQATGKVDGMAFVGCANGRELYRAADGTLVVVNPDDEKTKDTSKTKHKQADSVAPPAPGSAAPVQRCLK